MYNKSKLTVALLLAYQASALRDDSATDPVEETDVQVTETNEDVLGEDASCSNPHYQASYVDILYGAIASPVEPHLHYPPGRWGDYRYTPNGQELGPLIYGCDPSVTPYVQCCERYAVFDFKLEHVAYQRQSAFCKLQILSQNLRSSTVPNWWPLDNQLENHLYQEANETFDYYTDTMPGTRVKYIHSTGLVADASFIVTSHNHPYTGVFKSGCENAVLRLSDFSVGINYVAPMTPTLAFKCLRDYVHSANLFGAVHGDGTGNNWNWFEFPMTSAPLPSQSECKEETDARKSLSATKYISTTSNIDAAEYDSYGYRADHVVAPTVVYYEPITMGFAREFHFSWVDDLRQIPAGTDLYLVYGCDTRKELGGTCYEIGIIRQNSSLYTSEFGDNGLFYQHHRFERDVYHNPALRQDFFALTTRTTFAETGLEKASVKDEFGCPFAFMFAAYRASNYVSQPY